MLPKELPSPSLTNFADFGLPSEMTYGCQVKVTVLVYQGDLPFIGRATLVQSDLHHL